MGKCQELYIAIPLVGLLSIPECGNSLKGHLGLENTVLRSKNRPFLDQNPYQIRAQLGPTRRTHDLVVRIAGFSAYFVELSLECQNDLIIGTEDSL